MTDSKIRTCDTCKVRHQKCDGARPSCYHCTFRTIECVYSTRRSKPPRPPGARVSAGASRAEHRSISTAGGPLDKEEAVNGAAWSEAGEATIREIVAAALDSVDLTDAVKQNLIATISQQLAGQHALEAHSGNLPTDMNPTPLYVVSSPAIITCIADVVATENEQMAALMRSLSVTNSIPDLPSMMYMPSEPTDGSLPVGMIPPKAEVYRWIDTFAHGVNAWVYILDVGRCFELVEKFYNSIETMSSAEMATLYALLAAGSRYSENVSLEASSHWAEQARSWLEQSLQQTGGTQLWIMQPLLLICVTSLPSSPLAEWMRINLAVRIAQLYQLDKDFHNTGSLTKEEHVEWSPLWGTIVIVDVWLAVALGRVPTVSLTTSQLSSSRGSLGSPSDHIHLLGVTLNQILKEMSTVERVSSADYENFLHRLQVWESYMAPSLQLRDNEVESKEALERYGQDHASLLHLELFRSYAVLIVTQPMIQHKVATAGSSPLEWDMEESNWAQSCVDAASRISQASLKLGHFGAICKKMWIVTTINYYSVLVLYLVLITRAPIHAPKNASFEEALSALPSIIARSTKVLEFCAQQDPYAKRCAGLLKVLGDNLEPFLSNPSSNYQSMKFARG